jgi:methylphosphotriester-DNA--protein-cysteine methyltransferase
MKGPVHAILQELVYDSPVGGAVWPFDRAYIRPPHFHGQVELLLIRSGAATIHVGARAERLRAGQVCWILPCLPHVMSDFSPDFDMWVIELEAPVVGACWRALTGGGCATTAEAFGGVASLGERLAGRLVADVPRDGARQMSELALRIWSAPSTAGVRGMLRALCDLALRVTLSGVGPRRASSLTDLASCLLLASPLLDRRSLAIDLGVSEGFLSRSFGRDMGASFVEQRARSRVAHFLALVQDGRHNMLEAALDAGFGSYSQFHRVFTRVADVRPRDYFTSGRYRLQLYVAGDLIQPVTAAPRRLLDRQRHRAPCDKRRFAGADA